MKTYCGKRVSRFLSTLFVVPILLASCGSEYSESKIDKELKSLKCGELKNKSYASQLPPLTTKQKNKALQVFKAFEELHNALKKLEVAKRNNIPVYPEGNALVRSLKNCSVTQKNNSTYTTEETLTQVKGEKCPLESKTTSKVILRLDKQLNSSKGNTHWSLKVWGNKFKTLSSFNTLTSEQKSSIITVTRSDNTDSISSISTTLNFSSPKFGKVDYILTSEKESCKQVQNKNAFEWMGTHEQAELKFADFTAVFTWRLEATGPKTEAYQWDVNAVLINNETLEGEQAKEIKNLLEDASRYVTFK